ncbi:MAG: permease-like cell division protein FtsX [Coriobacteriales bacterium]|jgi:cell division transport system permease protein|nr:permease-like cell division protein FtsX [Coriobacteriales bacterium]
MRSFFYFIKEALRNTKKNFSTTVGAVITIFLSLLVIGVFILVSLVIDRVVQSVEDQVSITVFVADGAEQGNIDLLISYTQSLPDVSEVTFTTKEQAIEKFKETSDAGIVEQLDGNPLPASIEVQLADPEQVENVVAAITSHEVYLQVIHQPDNPATSIRYGKEIINQLFSVADTIRYVCMVLVVLLIFVALIFINNTIRLAILARRKEIAIMRLVGASNGFIRGPFLMEGALQSLVGAGLAVGTITLLCDNLLPHITSSISWLNLSLDTTELGQIYLLLLGVGVAIGLIGSALAMRRYLKV